MDASFIEHLRTLHRKLEYAQPPGSEEDAPAGDTTQPSAEECSPFTAEEAGLAGVRRAFDGTQVLDTQAARESLPQLERLRTKAAARARQFLLSEMGKLRDKRLNVGMWQQNVLLGVKKVRPAASPSLCSRLCVCELHTYSAPPLTTAHSLSLPVPPSSCPSWPATPPRWLPRSALPTRTV